jgi:SAM-dependent methyltransferase
MVSAADAVPAMSESFWNDRYTGTESSYGNNPNEFFKDQLLTRTPGELLLPGEGEGRNALFAAEMGWKVSAIDYSKVAQEKALSKARIKNLTIHYEKDDIGSCILPAAQYDAIALIYVHLPDKERKHLHRQCVNALKPGGTIILEAFSKGQQKYTSGGPKDPTMLYSLDEIQKDFLPLNVEMAREVTVHLDEGQFHQGLASIVRLVAKKADNV